MSLTVEGIGARPRPKEKKSASVRTVNIWTDKGVVAALKEAAEHHKSPLSTYAKRILRNVVAEDLTKDFGAPGPISRRRVIRRLDCLIVMGVESDFLARIDEVARRRGLNRSAYIEDVLRTALSSSGFLRLDCALYTEGERSR